MYVLLLWKWKKEIPIKLMHEHMVLYFPLFSSSLYFFRRSKLSKSLKSFKLFWYETSCTLSISIILTNWKYSRYLALLLIAPPLGKYPNLALSCQLMLYQDGLSYFLLTFRSLVSWSLRQLFSSVGRAALSRSEYSRDIASMTIKYHLR